MASIGFFANAQMDSPDLIVGLTSMTVHRILAGMARLALMELASIVAFVLLGEEERDVNVSTKRHYLTFSYFVYSFRHADSSKPDVNI